MSVNVNQTNQTFAQILPNLLHQPPLYLGKIYIQPTPYSASASFELYRFQSTDQDLVWDELDKWIAANPDILVEWI